MPSRYQFYVIFLSNGPRAADQPHSVVHMLGINPLMVFDWVITSCALLYVSDLPFFPSCLKSIPFIWFNSFHKRSVVRLTASSSCSVCSAWFIPLSTPTFLWWSLFVADLLVPLIHLVSLAEVFLCDNSLSWLHAVRSLASSKPQGV